MFVHAKVLERLILLFFNQAALGTIPLLSV